MTGFQVPRTTYKLTFAEADYAGLEIKVGGSTLDELFQLDQASEAIGDAKGTDEIRAAIRARNALFVAKVISWNMEDDGAPVPCTVDVLGTFEAPFVNQVIGAWRRAAAGVPAPLVTPSDAGGPSPTSEVESTLTEIPSESLAS